MYIKPQAYMYLAQVWSNLKTPHSWTGLFLCTLTPLRIIRSCYICFARVLSSTVGAFSENVSLHVLFPHSISEYKGVDLEHQYKHRVMVPRMCVSISQCSEEHVTHSIWLWCPPALMRLMPWWLEKSPLSTSWELSQATRTSLSDARMLQCLDNFSTLIPTY